MMEAEIETRLNAAGAIESYLGMFFTRKEKSEAVPSRQSETLSPLYPTR